MAHPQRKKKFVDPHVQGALIRRLVLHWISFLAVASVVAFFLQVLSDPFRPMREHFQQLWWTHGPFILVMAFLLPVFVVDTIKLSHRFAGPIYRLRQIVKQIAQDGEARPLKFRDFDFWQGLALDFNTMIERLSGKPVESNDDEAETPESQAAASNS